MKYDFSGRNIFGKITNMEYFFIPFGENELMLMINDISDRKKLEKNLTNEVEFNHAFSVLSQKIISAESIEAVSIFVLEQAKYFTKSPMGYAGYLDDKTGHLVTPTLMDDVWEKCKVQDKSYEFVNFVGLWGWVLNNKKPLYLNEIKGDPRSTGVPEGHIPIKKFLSVPVSMDGVLLGQISLINSSRDYTDKDIEILEKIANLYSIAIHQKRMLKTLEKSKKKADAANLAKSSFLSNMSHEIRTPMNSILGFSELLQNMISDPKQKLYLGSIYASGEILLNLINDILDLSKIEAGKLELDTALMNFHFLFKEIHQSFLIQASKKKIDFILEIDPNIPSNLLLDEFRLKQMLNNLISNALKFTDSGFIKICANRVQKNHKSIDLLISVQDTGIGISPLFLEKLFDPFSQKEGQDSKKYGGTGLGLSITKNLVEMMGGQISIDSEIRKGSTFTILLKQIKTGPKVSMGNASVAIVHDDAFTHIESPVIKISKEMVSKIPMIIESLETSLMKEWESITRNQHLPDIERFAKSIKMLGETCQFSYLIDYADALLLHIDNFDIERIQEALEGYHDLIKQVKELSIEGNA